MRPSLALLLWLAGPAAAADVCGTVDVQGRSLPSGFLTLAADAKPWKGADAMGGGIPHPGADERSMVRIRDGKFCMAGVGPGNYRPVLSPLGVPGRDVPVAYAGAPGLVESRRLSVDAGGTALYDEDGRKSGGGRLALSYVPPEPEPGWVPVEGLFRFPAGARPDLDRERILLVMTVIIETRQSYFLHWLTGKAERAEVAFTLSLPPGRLREFRVLSSRWAIEHMKPPLSGLPELKKGKPGAFGKVEGARDGDGCDSPDLSCLSPGTPLRVEATLAPKTVLRARALLPDGSPFRPYSGADVSRRSQLQFTAESLAADYRTSSFADAEGEVELSDLRAGLRTITPTWLGDGFMWAVGRARLFWLPEGGDLRADTRLIQDWAEVRVASRAWNAPPLPVEVYALNNPLKRRIYGVPAGKLGPLEVSSFLFDSEAPFSFLQTSEGTWRPDNVVSRPGPPAAMRVPEGRYDAYLVETGQVFEKPFVRVLALRAGLRLEPGRIEELAFADLPAYAEGTAALAGMLRGFRAKPADLKRAGSLSELHTRIAPRVDLFDARGRWVGSAFAAIPRADLAAMADALERDDAAALETLFHARRSFRIEGLAAGAYKARIWADGYPEREQAVVLKEGKVANLDADLDAI